MFNKVTFPPRTTEILMRRLCSCWARRWIRCDRS